MPLDMVCRLRRPSRQVSPGKNADCPHTPVASTPSPLGNLGFAVCGQLTLARVPPMRFVFLRPWVSPPASFRHHLAVTPLPLAHSKGCLPCRGLSPPSQRPCRAHHKQRACAISPALCRETRLVAGRTVRLSLCVLRSLARPLESGLFPFLDARIARQQARRAQGRSELGVGLEKRSGHAEADRPRLA